MSTHLIRDILELASREQERWDDPEFQHEPGTLVNESGGGAPAATVGADGGDGGVGGAGGEPGAEGEPGETGEPGPLTREDINDAFDERFQQLRGDLGQMFEGESGEPGQEGEPGYEGGEPDDFALADQIMQQAAETGEIAPEQLEQVVAIRSQQAVNQALETVLPQALEQALAPVHDRFLQQDADRLEQTYPALAEPETQQAVVQ